jgi:hypothetical protein
MNDVNVFFKNTIFGREFAYETYVDEHGEPIKRTPESHPYNHDGYIVARFGPNSEVNDTIYSDRLYQWDSTKHDHLCRKHFEDVAQGWGARDPKKIEAFLRDWTECPDLKLVFIMKYVNVSNGFPVWRFDIKRPT